MALAKRYTSTFEDRTGVTVLLELWQEGHVGGSSSFIMGGPDPLTGAAGLSGHDELEPIKGRVVTAKILTSAVMDAIYADSDPWEMRVLVGGTEDFRGPVIRPGRVQSKNEWGPRTDNQIQAICGLGDLAETTFFDAVTDDGIAEADEKTVAGWLVYLLDKVGHALPVYTASDLFALGMENSETPDDPLSQIYLPSRTWLRDGNTSRTLLDVLADLLGAREMNVQQRAGAWHCYARSLFVGSAFTRYQYASGSAGTTSGSTDSYTAKATVPSGALRKDAIEGDVGGYAYAPIDYRHGAIDNMIPNTPFNPPTPGDAEADGWTRGDAGAVSFVKRGPGTTYRGLFLGIAQTLGHNVSVWRVCKIDGVQVASDTEYADIPGLLDTGGNANNTLTQDLPTTFESDGISGLSFSVSVGVELPDAIVDRAATYTPRTYAFLQVKLVVGVTTYWLSREARKGTATWETSKSRVGIEIVGNGESNVEFVTEAPPGDGTIQVIYEGGATLPLSTIANPATAIYWRPDLAIIPILDDADHGSTVTISQVTGESGVRREPLEVMHGTGPTLIHPGCMRSSAGALWNDWQKGSVPGAPTGLTMEKVVGRTILDQTFDRLATLAGTYRRALVHPSLAFTEDGRDWLPVYSAYSYKTLHCAFEASELKDDAVAVTYELTQDVPQGSLRRIQNEGASIVIDRLIAEANRIVLEVSRIRETAAFATVIDDGTTINITRKIDDGSALKTIKRRVYVGPLTQLPTTPFRRKIRAGTPIIPAALDDDATTMVASQDHDVGSEILYVLETPANVPVGSHLIQDPIGEQAALLLEPGELSASVSGLVSSRAVGVLSDDLLAEDSPHVSIPVNSLPKAIDDNRDLVIVNRFGQGVAVRTNGAAAATDTAIVADSFSTGITFPAGSSVMLPDSEAIAEFILTAAELAIKLESDGVIGAINASPEALRINFDTISLNGSMAPGDTLESDGFVTASGGFSFSGNNDFELIVNSGMRLTGSVFEIDFNQASLTGIYWVDGFGGATGAKVEYYDLIGGIFNIEGGGATLQIIEMFASWDVNLLSMTAGNSVYRINADNIYLKANDYLWLGDSGVSWGFGGTLGTTRQTISGARQSLASGGALKQLLVALGAHGAITDSSADSPPTVTGSRSGNAALADLLTELDTLNIIDDQTTS